MAAIIIYLSISIAASLIFVILGIKQYNSDKPVSMNTGEKPPREEELASVSEWNHKHGRNWIIFGCLFLLTQSVFVWVMESFDNEFLELVLYFAVIAAEIAWLSIQHNLMKKKTIKDK